MAFVSAAPAVFLASEVQGCSKCPQRPASKYPQRPASLVWSSELLPLWAQERNQRVYVARRLGQTPWGLSRWGLCVGGVGRGCFCSWLSFLQVWGQQGSEALILALFLEAKSQCIIGSGGSWRHLQGWAWGWKRGFSEQRSWVGLRGPQKIKWHQNILKELKLELPYDPAILLTGIHPKEFKVVSQRAICILLSTAALFTVAKRCKNLRCQPADEWRNRKWRIHTMESYPGVLKSRKF